MIICIILSIKSNFNLQYIRLSKLRYSALNGIRSSHITFNKYSIIWITKSNIQIFTIWFWTLKVLASKSNSLIIRTFDWAIGWTDRCYSGCIIVLVTISRVRRYNLLPIIFIIGYFHNSFCIRSSSRCSEWEFIIFLVKSFHNITYLLSSLRVYKSNPDWFFNSFTILYVFKLTKSHSRYFN